jgi:TolA-binding protein
MVKELKDEGTITLHWTVQAIIAIVMAGMGVTGEHYRMVGNEEKTHLETVSLQEHQRVVSIQDENTRRIGKLEDKFDIIEKQHNDMENQLAVIQEGLKSLDKRLR